MMKDMEFEMNEKLDEIKDTNRYIGGAIRKITNYTNQYNNILKSIGVKSFDEVDFEKEEERYHIMTAFEQALCAARSHQGWIDEGNQIYLTQIGINGSQAQKEMTLFLQGENKKLNSDVMPTHEDQLLWLNSMYEKFRGCSIEYAKSKGMSTVSNIALLKEVKE